ncbi:Acetamidase, partial [Exophiala xenobiotica]
MGWEEIAADKKKRIDESIPKEWRVEVKDQNGSFMNLPASSGLLSSDELEITNSSAVDLVAKLASGQLKSVDVTLAFCKRAALAHQALNLALEFFPDMALAQAKELDKYYEEHKKP